MEKEHILNTRMNARRAIAATAAVIAVIGLAGCGGTALDPAPEIRAVTVTTEDGRAVDCVTRASGGIHCDWGNAR